MLHDILDMVIGQGGQSFTDKVHPTAAWIVLGGIGLITELHITAAILSIVYTGICIYIKIKDHKKNNS